MSKRILGLNFSYTNSEVANFCLKAPNCPYMRLACINYDFDLKHGVCQGYANRHSKGVRCGWLPYWVSNEHYLAILRGGHLHV